MKRVTLIIDDDDSDVITITAIATRGTVTNVNITAHKIEHDDVIRIPEPAEMEANHENN